MKIQPEKNVERTFFVSAGAQKGWETAGSGNTLPQNLSNPKYTFPVKFTFTSSYTPCLLSTGNK